MADLSVTPGDVVFDGSTASTPTQATAGEDLSAGDVVYAASGTGHLFKADANNTVDTAGAVGVMMCDAANGQPGLYTPTGKFITGGTVVVGEVYVVSENAGAIAPKSDLTSGSYVTILGYGSSVTQINLIPTTGPVASGVQIA